MATTPVFKEPGTRVITDFVVSDGNEASEPFYIGSDAGEAESAADALFANEGKAVTVIRTRIIRTTPAES